MNGRAARLGTTSETEIIGVVIIVGTSSKGTTESDETGSGLRQTVTMVPVGRALVVRERGLVTNPLPVCVFLPYGPYLVFITIGRVGVDTWRSRVNREGA